MSETENKTETTDGTEALIQREFRRRALGLDKMCDWDFEHDNGEDPILTGIGKNYVQNYKEMKEKGMGIMYFGGTGAGKSFASAQIVNALTDAGYDCLFTSFRNILTDLGTLTNDGKREYLNKLFQKDLIVFDEYGSEGDSGYCNQMILYIISTCCQRCIPMLVTTSYHKDNLVKTNNHLRLMTLSRLWQRCCCVQVSVPRSRRYKTKEELDKQEELLRGPGPYYEEAGAFKEPCQAEKEAVQRKEIAKKEAIAKAKAKAQELKLINQSKDKE